MGVPAEKVHTDRLYAGLDQLLPHKEALEKHLRQRLGELFELKYDLLLYDVTSTYFEGDSGRPTRWPSVAIPATAARIARRCASAWWSPKTAFRWATRSSPATARLDDGAEIVEAMEQKYGCANRVWVMDRGMVSEENLSSLHRSDAAYIVGTPKAMLRQFEQHLTDRDWTRCRRASR